MGWSAQLCADAEQEGGSAALLCLRLGCCATAFPLCASALLSGTVRGGDSQLWPSEAECRVAWKVFFCAQTASCSGEP